jgi:hypothetical protein
LKKLLEKNAKKSSVFAYEDTFKENSFTVLDNASELERCNIFFAQMIKSLLYDDVGAKAISTVNKVFYFCGIEIERSLLMYVAMRKGTSEHSALSLSAQRRGGQRRRRRRLSSSGDGV